MINVADTLLSILLRGSFAMGAVLIIVLIIRPRSYFLQRFACFIVLLQGWLFVPYSIKVPWYSAESNKTSHPSSEPVLLHATQTLPLVTANESVSSITLPSNTSSDPWAWFRVSIACAWLIGISWILTQIYRNFSALLRNSRTWHRAPTSWEEPWHRLLSHCNVRSPIPMFVSTQHGPMICRLPPYHCLVVPKSFWESCDDRERQLILRHELSHYQHRDLQTGWGMGALALPYWFHPAAWWGIKTWQQAAEFRADREAATSEIERLQFVRILEKAVHEPGIKPTVFAQCIHSHPLLRRIAALIQGPQAEDSRMRTSICYLALVALVLAQSIRVQLVAQDSAPPTTVAAVKEKMQAFEAKIESLSGVRESLKSDAQSLKESVDAKVASLEALANQPDQISSAAKQRAQQFHRNTEADQLEALKDISKHEPRDEAILLCGRAAKESEYGSVRQAAMKAACAMGKDGYAAIAIAYENLNTEDKFVLLQESRSFDPKDRAVIIAMMAKNANSELTAKLIKEPLTEDSRLAILGGLAESVGESAIKQIIEAAESTEGEQGMLLLYAAAKSNQPEHVLAAIKAARKRGAIAYPVIGAAGKCEDPAVRAEIVRAAKAWGGEVGEYIIEKATNDPNESLRNAAKEAFIE